MIRDLLLACAHHLAVFTIAAALTAELVLLFALLDAAAVRRLARLDALYGASALAVLAFGTLRVTWGARASAFYTDNPVFWTKLALFAVVGLLSIVPTVRYLRWRKLVDRGSMPSDAELVSTRRFVAFELLVFAAIPIAAAAMARGFGLAVGQ